MPNNDQALRVMLAQADALGLKVNAKWSAEQLAEAIIEAQRSAEEREREAFAAARKTPVRLRKNAFPLTGMKVSKGEIVEVPIDMAKRWVASGIAERADPFPGE